MMQPSEPAEAKPEGAGLAVLVAWFEGAEDNSQTARAEAERDRDYYDGKQLTKKERDALKRRGQPPLVFNLIRPRIETLKGLEIERRSDPRAYPRTPQHEQDAEAATDCLRYVADSTDFASVTSEAWENVLIEGVGGCIVGYNQETGEITATNIPWDRQFWDPHSRRPDFSDAKYKGIVVWSDVDDAKAMYAAYPEAETILNATLTDSTSNTYADRPAWQVWADAKRQRVRICEIYYKDRTGWRYAHFTKGGVLFDQPSPYLDEKGQPECPIHLTSAFCDRENNRYGTVRDLRDPQDAVNKRESKSLHILTNRQVRIGRGLEDQKENIRAEMAKPDGVVIADKDDFDALPTGDMAAGQMQMLENAIRLLSSIGPSEQSMGNAPSGASGRAVIAQQQASVIQRTPLMERLRQWKMACYRAMWNRVRQFWTAEKWVRVTDDERNVRFVGLNSPMRDEAGRPVIDQFGMPQMQNVVAHMEVDIHIEDAPDYVTIQAEQFDLLAQMLPTLVQAPPMWAELMIQASNLRNKAELLEKIRGMAQQQPPDPRQERAIELELEKAAADIDATRAKAAKDMAQAQPQLPAPADPGPSPLEDAERLAKIELTRAQTIKTMADASRPPPASTA